VLTIDLRGVGESERNFSTPGWKEAEDIRAAIRFFRENAPVRRIHLYAESLAAAAALVAWIRRYRRALQATILDAISWQPDWHALDVGTGTGMLLIGAAHRVPDGRAVGIDLWRDHAGGGSADDLRRNARAEGVGDRIELVQGDALELPFGDGTFDVVMASGAVHHIVRDRADFPRLVGEMTRVLRPGGHILLWDVPHIVEVTGERLREAGFEIARRPTPPFLWFANELLIARRPEATAAPVVAGRQAAASRLATARER
jgi:ubiquinone/menaquinone biosynthesis C-methylase UbiE